MQQKNSFSKQHPSPRYRELLAQYHQLHRDGDPVKGIQPQHMFDGRSLPRQAHRIRALISRTSAKTILDYGCGKGTQYAPGNIMENGVPKWRSIQEYWAVESILCYDPAYAPHSAMPQGEYDGVVCTDVLEHCPEEDLPWIIGELLLYARRFVFANIACYPAAKVLPNGENAHCTLLPVERWQALFEAAAAKRPHVLWECWADRQLGNPLAETRVANFPAPAAQALSGGRAAAWRMV